MARSLRTTLGFIVVETCEDFEQPLRLCTGDDLPKAGLLNWMDEPRHRAFLFRSRAEARSAILRTDHYRLAFGTEYPKKQDCRIVMVEAQANGASDADRA